MDSVFPTVKKYQSDNAKWKKFRALTCEQIVKNLCPLNIVDDPALHEIIWIANPRLSLLGSSTVNRDIKKMYNNKLQQNFLYSQKVTDFWYSTDAGTSFARKTYIDVSIHWITQDFRLISNFSLFSKQIQRRPWITKIMLMKFLRNIALEKRCLELLQIRRRPWNRGD